MNFTACPDFNDEWCELPEAEFQPILDFENQILDQAPHNDISLLTQRIKRSFLDYVRQGIMLYTVQRYRLYKQQYKDFAEYCKLALGRSHFYCKKIIQAAQVCLELIKSKFKILPTSVAQALPLAKFAKVDEYGGSELQSKWQTVLDGVPPEQITAVKIAETLDENPEDRAKQVRVSGKAYQLLQQKAAAAGMAVSKYLEMLIGGTEPPDDGEGECLGEGTELTPEKEEICDRAEAYIKSKSKKRGFPIRVRSKSYQKAISCKKNRSDKVSDSS
jgi:predicted DNA binding CopG/RHH family protein